MIGALWVASFSWFDPGWWLRTYDHGVVRAVPAFLLGMSLYRYRDELGTIVLRGWVFFPVVGVLLATMLLHGSGLVVLLLSYASVSILFILDRSVETRSTWLRYLAPLGQLTYSIYMLHPLFHAIVLALVAQRIVHLSGPTLYLASWISLPLLISVSYVSLNWFETPARRWIRAQWRSRRERVAA